MFSQVKLTKNLTSDLAGYGEARVVGKKVEIRVSVPLHAVPAVQNAITALREGALKRR